MDDLLQKYNDYIRLKNCRAEYLLSNGMIIDFTYKEENFIHLTIKFLKQKRFSRKIALPKFMQYTKTRSGTMEIKRDAYLEQLKIRKNNGMIKIITGIR